MVNQTIKLAFSTALIIGTLFYSASEGVAGQPAKHHSAPIQIAANDPASIVANLKKNLNSARKKAGNLAQSAWKYKSIKVGRRSPAQLRKDVANARKAEKAVISQQRTVSNLKRQLGKFKNAPSRDR